ncbi:PTS glucose transporter subunit IIA [Cellulosimicrobium arenosum]|uniref:PTS glucose transporter subunit IIA n=1 Tax=Cellulosimicrobium arenosum TaxID=2708133 RepID=A0A927J2D4_9MICO|nr:PTS glucose transporter subunit IIA [Cellulosimicrobium arenosum]MBD8080602.1 PTS glucose transporter subunit IIA [Cellulosimicrobium arenosum]
MSSLLVTSPLAGSVVALSAVPDPVFSQQIVGPGIAIDPEPVEHSHVVAPADGRIGSLFPHAFALETTSGRAILVHLGIDTVNLRGDGFTLHVEAGAEVRRGDLVITWDPARVVAAGLSTVCPVVALQAEPDRVRVRATAGAAVVAQDPLFSWS